MNDLEFLPLNLEDFDVLTTISMAEKQLILVVEGTAAMGPYWSTIVSDYLEKIIRFFR